MMELPSGQHRRSFSLHERRWSLLFLQFAFDPCLSSFPMIHPPGRDKDRPSNKRSRCLSGPSVRLLRKRRQRERSMEAGRTERTGERRGELAVSPTPEVPGSPRLSVPYLQKTLFRDSPNEHSCPHSAPQWSPPLPLSLLTMENIAPIKPQRQ